MDEILDPSLAVEGVLVQGDREFGLAMLEPSLPLFHPRIQTELFKPAQVLLLAKLVR